LDAGRFGGNTSWGYRDIYIFKQFNGGGNMGKFLSMAALIVCQAASIFMNGNYGWSIGWLFMFIYVAYDLATLRLIDHSQNPKLEDGYQIFAGVLAVVTVLFSVWTATAMMAVSSYKKTVADNNSAIATQESLRDNALSSARQSRKASEAKQHLESMYLDKASGFDTDAKEAQSEIDRLQAQTPSDRNAIYSVLDSVIGSTIAKTIEFIMMLIGGTLVAVLGVSLFLFDRRLDYRKTVESRVSRNTMKDNEKTQSRTSTSSETKEKTMPKKEINGRAHKEYKKIRNAVLMREFSGMPTKKKIGFMGVGGEYQGAILKALAEDGHLIKTKQGTYKYPTDKVRAV
jgi:hypothetical protein